MNNSDALDKAQFLVDHWYYIVAVVTGSVIAYFRLPWIIDLAKKGLAKINFPNFIPSPGKKTTSGNADVLSLIDQMVASLPAITDEALHNQAVEASVSFAEAVIRQAGLVQQEQK